MQLYMYKFKNALEASSLRSPRRAVGDGGAGARESCLRKNSAGPALAAIGPALPWSAPLEAQVSPAASASPLSLSSAVLDSRPRAEAAVPAGEARGRRSTRFRGAAAEPCPGRKAFGVGPSSRPVHTGVGRAAARQSRQATSAPRPELREPNPLSPPRVGAIRLPGAPGRGAPTPPCSGSP